MTVFPQCLNFFVMPFLPCFWHWGRINKLPLSKYLYLNKLPCPAARNPPVNAILQKAGPGQRPFPEAVPKAGVLSQRKPLCWTSIWRVDLYFCKWERAGGWAWLRIWLQFLGMHTQPQTCRIFPKTWSAQLALPAPPSPQNVVANSGARRWQLCFLLFLRLIILQQSPNKTFFEQTQNVYFAGQKMNPLPVVCMASHIFLSLLTVKWLDIPTDTATKAGSQMPCKLINQSVYYISNLKGILLQTQCLNLLRHLQPIMLTLPH